MPGIEMAAPDLTETRRGEAGSPNFIPISCSTFINFGLRDRNATKHQIVKYLFQVDNDFVPTSRRQLLASFVILRTSLNLILVKSDGIESSNVHHVLEQQYGFAPTALLV
jgi:hypothetical protein